MLHFVYGLPGSGKSRSVYRTIAEKLKERKKVILLVPERFSVTAEKEVTGFCGDLYKMNLDVLSFKRLCNRVFREYGGLCDNYAGKGARILMMMRALQSVRPELKAYGNLGVYEEGTVKALHESIVSFKRAGLDPEVFEEASKQCKGDPQLAAKTADLCRIWRAYNDLLHEKYDDPEEDMDRLAYLIGAHGFFEDKEVFIDSFTAFTGQEMRILEEAVRQSPHVTAVIPCLPEKDDPRPIFSKLRRIEARLTQAAAEAGEQIGYVTVLETLHTKSEGQRALERVLYTDFEPDRPITEGLSLSLYPSVYEECKAIAAGILRDVQKGGRFMDHAVVVRDLSSYKGVIDQVFESNGVPYTMKNSVSLSEKGPGRLILSALRLLNANFRPEDLIDYMKTGYAGVSDGECFLLEDYINLWQIEGRSRWLGQEDFAMNPSGHIAERTDKDFEKLEEINAVARKLTAPLLQLYDDCSSCGAAAGYAAAIFDYLTELKVEERLALEVSEAEARGEGYEAQLLGQCFPAVCEVLDEFVYAMGDEPLTLEGTAAVLELLLAEKTLSGIPAGKDRVLVSDAFDLKAGGVRTLYAAGMAEGVFPSYTRPGGMFTPREAAALRALHVDLPQDEDRMVNDERYLCYSVLTMPRADLCVSSYRKDLRGMPSRPSELYETLCAYAGVRVEDTFNDGRSEELLYGRANCLERSLQKSDDPDTLALRALFREKNEERLTALKNAPLVAKNESLSPEVTKALYGDGPLRLSQSRIESFLNCPLSYVCKDILKLQEKSSEDIMQNEVGTAVHRVFERLIGQSIREHETFGSLTDAEVKARVKAIVDDIKKDSSGGAPDIEAQLVFDKIGQVASVLALNIRDEFAQSGFRPAFCEIRFGTGKKDEGVHLLPVAVCGEDGKEKVLLSGTADRVDVYKENGRIYLRVVDYKTGDKTFDLDAVDLGQNVQMLLYLKALLKSRDPAFLKGVDYKEGDVILPAGVEYFIARAGNVDLAKVRTAQEIRRAVGKSITRSGVIIDDPDVVEEMERGMGGLFLPPKTVATLPANVLSEKLEGLDRTLSEIADDIRSGRADMKPLGRNEKGSAPEDRYRSGCTFCPMAPVCRKTKTAQEED